MAPSIESGSAVAVTVAALALLLAPAGRGGVVLDRAAASLANDPVYVDPDAQPSLSNAEEAQLESTIAAEGEGPVYVAVLPSAAAAEAGGSASEALQELAADVDRRGVFAVVTGGQFRAGATGDTGLERGEAAALATDAFQAHSDDGLAATLVDFVERVGDARAGSGTDEGGGGFPWWLAILVGGAVLYFVARRRRRARAARAEFAEVKEAARGSGRPRDRGAGTRARRRAEPAANAAYLRALDHYARASGAFDRARTPQALEPVAQSLDDGRYEMAVAKAELAGEQPPERRAPCFFDPRHGTSVRDVAWSPDGGALRDVPACAACALRVERGEEPESRQVVAGGRAMPYWAAGPGFGSYFGGFFPGLLLGQMLFGGLGPFGGPKTLRPPTAATSGAAGTAATSAAEAISVAEATSEAAATRGSRPRDFCGGCVRHATTRAGRAQARPALCSCA